MNAPLAERYNALRASLPGHVKLIAVSKTRTAEEVQALYDLGHRVFGENYPQELKEKAAGLPKDIEWHFIGHLQRSNVKHVMPIAHLIHGVDSERLLEEIEKRARAAGTPVNCLLQVHVAQEETKHGFTPEELLAWVSSTPLISRYPHVVIKGLMAMATNSNDATLITQEFIRVKGLFDQLRTAPGIDAAHFTEMSMGMSGDAPLAIAAGSTMVRIGTAIFGERG